MSCKQPKVSIIVPVYNGERSLSRCIDSILKQQFTEWELLLINDGSTDGSLSVCQEYAKKCENIRVINKENEGVSATRNLGIQNAVGEYIQFIDCDDYVAQDYLASMVKSIEEQDADMVIAGYTRHKNGKMKQNAPGQYVINGIEQLAEQFFSLYNHWYINTPWNKLYKRALISEGFPLELSLGEDLMFNLEYLKKVKKISVIEKVGYEYCIENVDSLAIQFREDKFENSCYLHRQVLQFAREQLGLEKEADWQDQAFVKQIRFSISSLVKAEGMSAIEKKQKIGEWIRRQEVVDAYRRAIRLEKQDILLRFLALKRKEQWIYRIMKLV